VGGRGGRRFADSFRSSALSDAERSPFAISLADGDGGSSGASHFFSFVRTGEDSSTISGRRAAEDRCERAVGPRGGLASRAPRSAPVCRALFRSSYSGRTSSTASCKRTNGSRRGSGGAAVDPIFLARRGRAEIVAYKEEATREAD
jgi:hypothetical protein